MSIIMKTPIFTGSGVAIVTPFTNDGIDFAKLGELVDFQIENGTDSIIVCGTTGEASTMNDKEHLACIEYVIKKVDKRVPVIAGTGSNDTRHGVELSIEAEKAGADGLLLVTPYYNKTSQKGLVKHFLENAEKVNTPIILYNVPSRTGLNICVEAARELSAHPNINAIKEASGNISYVAQLAQACGDDLLLYSGNDDMIVPIMSLGGIGVISVVANILPKQTHDIVEKYLTGDNDGSRRLQLEMLPLINALFAEVNPIPIKTAMNLMGFDVGFLRPPLYEIGDKANECLKAELKNYGLLK